MVYSSLSQSSLGQTVNPPCFLSQNAAVVCQTKANDSGRTDKPVCRKERVSFSPVASAQDYAKRQSELKQRSERCSDSFSLSSEELISLKSKEMLASNIDYVCYLKFINLTFLWQAGVQGRMEQHQLDSKGKK